MLKISSESFVSLVEHEYDEKIKASADNIARKSELYNICTVVSKNKSDIDFIFDLAIQITNSYKKKFIKELIKEK